MTKMRSHETNNLLCWSRLVVIVKVYLSLLWPQSHWNLLIVCSCFREILLHVPQYWRENNTSSARSLHNIMVTVPTVSVESRWRRDKYRQSDKALPSRTGILRPSDYCIDTLQYDYSTEIRKTVQQRCHSKRRQPLYCICFLIRNSHYYNRTSVTTTINLALFWTGQRATTFSIQYRKIS